MLFLINNGDLFGNLRTTTLPTLSTARTSRVVQYVNNICCTYIYSDYSCLAHRATTKTLVG